MGVGSSRREYLASTAGAECWVDAALGSEMEDAGEDATCWCRP